MDSFHFYCFLEKQSQRKEVCSVDYLELTWVASPQRGHKLNLRGYKMINSRKNHLSVHIFHEFTSLPLKTKLKCS